ncbi:MAG: DUF2500 domain-containing protein [Tissierellales bacterium]|jgi:hypothetical protein|nr:DUF2500 domain-containing protein [Tissierellales bacterium]
MGMESNFMFDVFPYIFGAMFILIFGMFLTAIVKGIQQWDKNNKSPVLTVDAKIVAKRVDQRRSSSSNDHMSDSIRTDYYVTFEFDSGDRSEFELQGNQYGLLIEGDRGKLTFQGTRYKDFKRV